jgi:hypothetical protein
MKVWIKSVNTSMPCIKTNLIFLLSKFLCMYLQHYIKFEVQAQLQTQVGKVHVIPQVGRMKAYIFNYKIHVHDNRLCIIYRLS